MERTLQTIKKYEIGQYVSNIRHIIFDRLKNGFYWWYN